MNKSLYLALMLGTMACNSERSNSDTAVQSTQPDAPGDATPAADSDLAIHSYVHDTESGTLLVRTADETCVSLVTDQDLSTNTLKVASVRTGECDGASRYHKLKIDRSFRGTIVLTNPVTNYKLDDLALCDLENFNQWFQVGTNPVSFNLKREMTFGYGFSKTDKRLPSAPDRLDEGNILVSDCASEADILRNYFYEFTNDTF